MRKGFTLIEIVVSIVILILLFILVMPAINKIFGESNIDSRNAKILEIETAGYEYFSLNKDIVKDGSNSCLVISVEDIIKAGYILSESKTKYEIIDPVTNQPFDGRICSCYNDETLDIEIKYLDNKTNCVIENIK